jgi:amidophosphoribosyltransferase
MDTGTRSELLAANLTVQEIQDYLDVDSLAYLTLDNLLEATGTNNAGFCSACLTGDYPVDIPVNLSKKILEKSIHRPEISVATPQKNISGGFQQPLSEIHE